MEKGAHSGIAGRHGKWCGHVENPHRTPWKPQFPLPSLHPKGLEAGSRAEPRTPTFTAALFTRAKSWKATHVSTGRGPDEIGVARRAVMNKKGIQLMS